MSDITTIEQLESIYGTPAETATVKVTDEITDDYRRFIEASPFLALATSGPNGLDCSPRGDSPGFVRLEGSKCLLLPDRRGNNRIDSLRNIVLDPRVALLFFVPGSLMTVRVNGLARISVERERLDSFETDGKPPRSVIVIDVQEVFFQCGRAILRSDLWNAEHHIGEGQLPTPGEILANLSDDRVGGDGYDQEWPERARNTLW
ncbi:MAG: pyridoxamine 5'-phosphate oxidase family protein [Planctomycetota bacterium]